MKPGNSTNEVPSGASALSKEDRRKKQKDDPYRDRILEAARELFAENGLEAVSMYQIAKKSGMGQGSLYRRYADKGEICSDLLGSSSNRFLTELELEVVSPGSTADTLQRLKGCIEKIIDFIDQHGDLLQMIKAEFTGKNQFTQFEHPIFQRLHAVIVSLLRQASDRDEIIAIDTHFAATALISVLGPDLYLYQQKAYGASKEQILEGIITLFVAGLQKAK